MHYSLKQGRAEKGGGANIKKMNRFCEILNRMSQKREGEGASTPTPPSVCLQEAFIDSKMSPFKEFVHILYIFSVL